MASPVSSLPGKPDPTLPKSRGLSYQQLLDTDTHAVPAILRETSPRHLGSHDIPVEEFLGLARSVRSRLFSMDLGRCRDGRWIVIELGDGQVNALPPPTDVGAFFARLRKVLG